VTEQHSSPEFTDKDSLGTAASNQLLRSQVTVLQDQSYRQLPSPTLALSALPGILLSKLTVAPGKSPTRHLSDVERATVAITRGGVPEITQERLDDELLARAARYLHGLLGRAGRASYSGPELAEYLESTYRPWQGRPGRGNERGWQLLASVDADPTFAVQVWLAADPITPIGDRREMRLSARVAELASRS